MGSPVSTFFLVTMCLFGVVTSEESEKREMPNQFAYSVYRTGDTGFNGGYTSVSSGAAERQGQLPPGFNVAIGPAAPSVGNFPGGPGGPNTGMQGPPYPPYAYKDPGFSVQTGFEGFLVPNPWYGAISWGIEGLVIAGIAIVFVLALKAGLIFLLFRIFRFGKFFKDDEGESAEPASRSYIPSIFNQQNLQKLTTNVMDAIDKYNTLIREDQQ